MHKLRVQTFNFDTNSAKVPFQPGMTQSGIYVVSGWGWSPESLSIPLLNLQGGRGLQTMFNHTSQKFNQLPVTTEILIETLNSGSPTDDQHSRRRHAQESMRGARGRPRVVPIPTPGSAYSSLPFGCVWVMLYNKCEYRGLSEFCEPF